MMQPSNPVLVFIYLGLSLLQEQAMCSSISNWRRFSQRLQAHYVHKHHGGKLDPEEPFLVDLIDPCVELTCNHNEVCIAHQGRNAKCIPNEEIIDFDIDQCTLCHHHSVSNSQHVCASNNQTFGSICEVRYMACIMGSDLRPTCNHECPCVLPEDIYEPRDFKVVPLSGDSSHLLATWLPPIGYETAGDVQEYLLHYTKVGDGSWKQVRTPGILTSIKIAGLSPHSFYYLRIQAVIYNTKGRMSDVAVVSSDDLQSEIMDYLQIDTEWGDIADDEDASGDGERSN